MGVFKNRRAALFGFVDDEPRDLRQYRNFAVFPILHTNDDPEMFYPPDTDPGQAAVNVNFQDIGFGLHAVDFDSRGGLWRFQNVKITPGRSILSAHILFRAHSTPETGENQLRFQGLDEDDADALDPTDGGTADENRYADFDSRPKTAAYVDWLDTPKTSPTQFARWTSPELKTIVQEIIDRGHGGNPGNWQSGNALALYVESVLDKYRIQDTFSAVSGTLLQNHAPDTGSGWTKEGGSSDIEIQGGVIQCAGSGDSEMYTEDTVFSHNQYEILFDVTSQGVGTNDGIKVYFNWTDSSNHYYVDIRHKRDWRLFKVVAGTPTELASGDPAADDTSFSVKIHVHHANGSLQVFKDGSEYVIGHNNDDITAPGQVGLKFVDDTYKIDNFDVRGSGIFLTSSRYNLGSQYAAKLIVKYTGIGVGVQGALAAATALAPTPAVAIGISIEAVIAAATALSLATTITTGAGVSAALPAATGLSPAVTIQVGVLVDAVTAPATALAPTPDVKGAASIAAVQAAAAAQVLAAEVGIGVTVSAAGVLATALAPDSTVNTGIVIDAEVAPAVAAALAAAIAGGGQVSAALPTASALSPAVAVQYGSVIAAEVALAAAQAPASVSMGGLAIDAAVALATAQSHEAGVGVGMTVDGEVGAASALAQPATIASAMTINAVVVAATALALAATVPVAALHRLAYHHQSLLGSRTRRRGRR